MTCPKKPRIGRDVEWAMCCRYKGRFASPRRWRQIQAVTVVVSTNGRLAQLLPPQLELLPYPPKINLRAKLAKHGGTFGRCLHKMLCLQ
jgi:hypothetical protein